MTTPKLHTSLAEEKVRKAMASGAVQRMGIFPPCEGHGTIEHVSSAPARELDTASCFPGGGPFPPGSRSAVQWGRGRGRGQGPWPGEGADQGAQSRQLLRNLNEGGCVSVWCIVDSQ